jgi:UrcA family protein
MRLASFLRATSYLAVAALGLALGGQASATQGDDVVIVTQSPRQLGPRAQDPIVSLTGRISYADLDLSTGTGAAQLEVRVHEAANTLCDELARRASLLPNIGERLACVRGAVANGMDHARAAIAVAGRRTRTAAGATSH